MEGDDTIRRLAQSHALALAESGTISGDECAVLVDAIALSFAGVTPAADAIDLLVAHGFLDDDEDGEETPPIPRQNVDYRALKPRRPGAVLRSPVCPGRRRAPVAPATRWRARPPDPAA